MCSISSVVFLSVFFIHLLIFLFSFIYTPRTKKEVYLGIVTAKPVLWSMLQLNIYCTTVILQKRQIEKYTNK